jgi:protein required for attachment to host cells
MDWALVADAQRARILERPSAGGPWTERAEEELRLDNPPSREQGSDRPGRVRESVGAARHAVEPRQDPHQAAKQAFARRLAARLETAATEGRYARLMLVAPPAFLGWLREALGDGTRPLVQGSLDKDLVHAHLAEIAARLDEARAD